MRVSGAYYSPYTIMPPYPVNRREEAESRPPSTVAGQGVTKPAKDSVDISGEARALLAANRADSSWEVEVEQAASESGESPAAGAGKEAGATTECKRCNGRKYKDVSDDPTVSFQTPTRLTPEAAASQVRSHEQEHVTNEQAKAQKDGRQVVSQSVALKYAVCPECGRSYVAGGTTTTVTKNKPANTPPSSFSKYA